MPLGIVGSSVARTRSRSDPSTNTSTESAKEPIWQFPRTKTPTFKLLDLRD